MTHKISIIIIVKDDRGIVNTLDAIATQEKPVATEVLVIDASKPDVLKDIKDTHPEVMWHQFVPKIANKSSIPEQRNYGIRHANGDIIVFIDANCVPVDGWLKKLTAPILSDEEDITAGQFGSVDTSSRVVTLDSHPYEYLTCSGTGNLAFRKSVWKTVGGFDEDFLYGSDIDFTWRCVDAGYRIRSVPNSGVSHDWGTTGEDLQRSFKYGKARADLLIKHPHRVRVQLMGESKFIVVYTMWLLGLPLTLVWPWYPLTITLLLLRNYRHKPVKVVSMNLIYTLGFYRKLLGHLIK
jgi:glycosyltransferase involved in cell wall biosynthesis